MSRIVRVTIIASAFFFFWWGAVLLAWILVPILHLVRREERARRRLCQRIVQQSFRLFHGYMSFFGLLRVTVADTGHARPEGAAVIIANHPTLVDVTALLSIYGDFCCVVKPSLLRNPFIGRLLRACGHIDAGSGEGLSGGEAMQQALDRLAEGASVLIFPEGTRSPPGGMRRFRRGAFELARRAGVPIFPIFLRCTPPALSKGVPFWAQPDDFAELRIHPRAVVTAAAPAMTSRRLRQTVENEFHFSLDMAGVRPENTASPAGAESP